MIRALLLCLLISPDPMAVWQSTARPSPQTKPAILSGRGFIISRAGDLKPSRLADVHVLWVNALSKNGKPPKEEPSAGFVFQEENISATENETSKLDNEGKDWSEKQMCLSDLHTFPRTMLKTFQWAHEHQKSAQITTVQTDEEGKFSVGLREGVYMVFVYGRAGIYEALWVDGFVKIHSGLATDLKLSSPKKSCSDLMSNR